MSVDSRIPSSQHHPIPQCRKRSARPVADPDPEEAFLASSASPLAPEEVFAFLTEMNICQARLLAAVDLAHGWGGNKP